MNADNRGNNTNYYSIYFVLILIVFILLLLVDVTKLRKTSDTDDKINQSFETSMLGSQTQTIKRNCDIELVYSMDDNQCNNICFTDKSTFRSKNGVCVNSLVFEMTTVENKCSAKDGVLAFLIGDPMFGRTKMLCLSIDPGIQPDSTSKPNVICQNGSIEIDYVKGFPQLRDCKCWPGDTLAIIEATSVVRQRGVCVAENLKAPMDYNSLLYNKNAV